jgi:hypothetical protein
MAPSRAYVPSRALLRALSRPVSPRCPFFRPTTTPFIRGKRTKAVKAENAVKPSAEFEKLLLQNMMMDIEDHQNDDNFVIPTDEELEDPSIPPITWYQQDLAKGTPRQLIERIATPEDRKRHAQMARMIQASKTDPNYDDAELNRRLVDSLISNPNFADLTKELKRIKEGIKSKEEMAELEAQSEKDTEKDIQDLNTNMRTATYEAILELQSDPDASAAKAELQEVLDNLPEMENLDDPKFQDLLNKAMTKLNDDPRFQAKMAAKADELEAEEAEVEKKWTAMEQDIDETVRELERDDDDVEGIPRPDVDDGSMDTLMIQMRDLLKSLGGDAALEAELDAVLREDPYDPNTEPDGAFDSNMDFEELAIELEKMVKAQLPRIQEEMAVPADLQAKVDKIMADPRLMEKLEYIQGLIAEANEAKADITNIAHEVAPDPYELDDTRTATLKQRMEMARQTPEHTAALDRLRVNLSSPFNISPALKSFNQAIELAYIGANDDIRRILWRSYMKARTLPTFLPNMSNEAWDILYYSQAVTWGANQNRQAHLRTLLADLKTVGRDGPPSHPSQFAPGWADGPVEAEAEVVR